MSGERVGFLYTTNKDLLKGYSTIGFFNQVSAHTQYLVGELFAEKNETWLNNFLERNLKRLYLANYVLRDGIKNILNLTN